MTKLICPHCKESSISQEVTFLIDPNDIPKVYTISCGEFLFQDFFWCNKCDEEINPEEIE